MLGKEPTDYRARRRDKNATSHQPGDVRHDVIVRNRMFWGLRCPDGPRFRTVALSAKVDFRRASEDVARGIALAMGDAGVRAAVRDAMRESLVTEHKLLLQDFVKPHAAACW